MSFDRILNSREILHSRNFEVLDKICKTHSTTLRNAEYRVQTVLDSSQRYFKHSITSSIHGSCQDLGSSSIHWVFIDVPMMSTLEKQNNGCTIISPDKNIKWKTIIIGVVDDKRLFANNWKINSLLAAANKLQSVA